MEVKVEVEGGAAVERVGLPRVEPANRDVNGSVCFAVVDALVTLTVTDALVTGALGSFHGVEATEGASEGDVVVLRSDDSRGGAAVPEVASRADGRGCVDGD